MLLFSAYCLLDSEEHYKQVAQDRIHKRLQSILDGMELTLPEDENRVGYYIELDFLVGAEQHYGKTFCEFLKANYEPTDILFRLAEQTGIVLLNGSGFEGPEWSVRVSLANLNDVDYEQIGQAMMKVAGRIRQRVARLSREYGGIRIWLTPSSPLGWVSPCRR